jgi:hypothetical protein
MTLLTSTSRASSKRSRDDFQVRDELFHRLPPRLRIRRSQNR